MDLKAAKRKALERARTAQSSARKLAESNAVIKTRQLAVDAIQKAKATTDEALYSELADSVLKSAKLSGKKTRQMTSDAMDWVQGQWIAATEETNDGNWYLRSAKACEDVSDAVMGNPDGVSSKISRGVAAKLGAAGTTAGIFSLASLLGTASTGTAIGTLSGAAFTSSALAWVGGSVAAGTAILGVAAVAGGIGAGLGAAWAAKRFLYGQKREPTELELQERKVVEACLALAITFRKQAEAGNPVDRVSANYLYGEALAPLCEELAELQKKTSSWPYMAQQRLKKARQKLMSLSDTLRDWSIQHPNVTTGVVSVVFLQLLAGEVDSFSGDELLVLDALRRSNSSLSDASNEELAEYVQGLEPGQMQGLQNNVKGIYHEIRFVDAENSDGDQYVAELFEATNHPGADVRITNLETGDVREIQLKATDYISLLKEHNSRYESIDVFATSELADATPGVESTGLSNEALSGDVEDAMETLEDYYDPGVLDSMAAAGMVALARNIRVVLKGNCMTEAERRKLVQDGAISAGVAGLFSLVLG